MYVTLYDIVGLWPAIHKTRDSFTYEAVSVQLELILLKSLFTPWFTLVTITLGKDSPSWQKVPLAAFMLFQTRLLLATLPLCGICLPFESYSSQRLRSFSFINERHPSLSWIKFTCMRSAAFGKVAGLSIYWQNTAYRLVIKISNCGK